MLKQFSTLTDEQSERMGSFTQEWIDYGLRTAPLTEQEWAVWEAGVRKCYEFAGIACPAVVRVSSPIAATFVVPTTGHIIDGLRRAALIDETLPESVNGLIGERLLPEAKASVLASVHKSVLNLVGAPLLKAVQDLVLMSATEESLLASAPIGVPVLSEIEHAVRDQVSDVLTRAVEGSLLSRVLRSVREPVRRSQDLLRTAVQDAVRTTNPFPGAFSGGRMWCDWEAYVSFFRDVAGLEISGDVWERARAYQDAQSAGWWFPFRDMILVCDLPCEVHTEQFTTNRRTDVERWGGNLVATLQNPESGGRRFHCDTGPAITWADGWGAYYWHGVPVPAWVIESPSAARAMAETNTEVRRAALEATGWDNVVFQLGLVPIDSCPDFANGNNTLDLFELPTAMTNGRSNLLLMTNASPDLDGRIRRYGEPVPARIRRADEAAAWQSDVPVEVYRRLERCT